MKKLWVILIILAYIILINLIFNLSPQQEIKINGNGGDETMVEVGVSDKVEVFVLRKRWYGNIYEFSSDYKKSYIHLFDFSFLKILYMKNKINYLYIHLVFAVLLYLFARKKVKGGKK